MSLAVPCSGRSADVPDIHPVNTNKMSQMVMMLFLLSFIMLNIFQHPSNILCSNQAMRYYYC